MQHSYTAESLALIPATHLPVLPRSPRIVAPASFTGPGKTLHEIYSTLGDRAEKHANRAAHSLGLGPAAVAERIRIFFADGSQREAALSELREGIPRKLEKECGRLVRYALPSETSSTQLEAFKSLVALTTQYPGTRRIFLDCESLKNAGVQGDAITALWNRPAEVCGDQWHFHRNFAATCVADLEISSMVEDIPPQSLGSVLDQGAGLSIIERILVASDCEGSSTFSRFIAVRYLGGILDLPSFWLQSGMMLRAVVQKILVRATTLLKDLGVDSVRSDDSMLSVPSDIEGVDILCEVLLVRIQSWLPDRLSSEITCEAWYPSLYHVVQLLRQPKTEDLLPRSWTLATGEEFRELVPSQYQTRVVATLSAIQLSDQVHSLYHEREAPPQKDDLYRRTETKLKVKIRRATSKDRIRQYGKVTYTLLNQPYLQAMATVSLLIMEMIQCVKDTEQAGVKMAERSYQLVCAIINICHDSEADLAPTMIRNIAQFSEYVLFSVLRVPPTVFPSRTLEKILTFVRGQVKGSFWRRILRSMEDADLIAECNAGLKHASDVFGVQSGITAIMPMAEMRVRSACLATHVYPSRCQKYATQRHEELITILKEKRSRLKRSWTPDWDDSPTSAPRKKLLELLGSPVGLDASSTMLGDGRDQTYLIVL